MERIELFNYSREVEEEKKKAFLEGQDNAQPKQPLTNQTHSSIKAASQASQTTSSDKAVEKPTPSRADEHKVGDIDIAYSYVRFNAASHYVEVNKSFAGKSVWDAMLGKEATYQHKGDGSKIHVHKNKIAIDNTPENIIAALDIAQDKGWTAINIKGGSREAQAELWYQAQMRGLDTRGYKPSEQDMKRLLGAQERERQAQAEKLAKEADKLTENLDIKPKSPETESLTQTEEKPQTAKPTPEAAKPEKSSEQGKEKPSSDKTAEPASVTVDREINPTLKDTEQTADAKKASTVEKNPESKPVKEKSPKNRKTTKEQDASADERIAVARREIMNEVERYFPLNEQEYSDLEKSVEQQLTYAAKGGKGNLKKVTDEIKKGLPMVRKELDQAAKLEQSRAIRDAQKAHKTPSKNPAVQAAAKASEVRQPKTERER